MCIKQKKCAKRKKIQLQSILNVMVCVDQRIAVMNSAIILVCVFSDLDISL